MLVFQPWGISILHFARLYSCKQWVVLGLGHFSEKNTNNGIFRGKGENLKFLGIIQTY
jgi:hypothetical protein